VVENKTQKDWLGQAPRHKRKRRRQNWAVLFYLVGRARPGKARRHYKTKTRPRLKATYTESKSLTKVKSIHQRQRQRKTRKEKKQGIAAKIGPSFSVLSCLA
jgi:hypothetical protein